jgi:hypothetical protein
MDALSFACPPSLSLFQKNPCVEHKISKILKIRGETPSGTSAFKFVHFSIAYLGEKHGMRGASNIALCLLVSVVRISDTAHLATNLEAPSITPLPHTWTPAPSPKTQELDKSRMTKISSFVPAGAELSEAIAKEIKEVGNYQLSKESRFSVDKCRLLAQ